jgi:dipeptidyl-peptidase 4
MRAALLLVLLLVPGTLPAQNGNLSDPELRGGGEHAEKAEWSALTPHEEVVSLFRELSARTPEARLQRIGISLEGRPILLLVLSRPAIATPWEAAASGKPVVLIAAQVHGDEPAGKEGLLRLAGELVDGPLTHLLDDVVFLLIPEINPDGGAAGEWGTRANRAGFNLNRDYLRLQNPETSAVVEQVIVPWRPHVIVDAHELPGPPRMYDFYTLGPDNLHGPAGPERFAKERVIPAVVDAVEAHGFTHFVYHVPGNVTADPSEGLSGGSHGARTLTSYGGAQGAISILFETLRERDPRVGIERRAGIQHLAMRALAEFVAGHAAEVVSVVAEGRIEMSARDARADAANSIPVLWDLVSRRNVAYRLRETASTGAGWAATGEVIEVEVPLLDSAAVTLARTRPAGYVIEAHREDLARHLARHGVHVERVIEPVRVRAESFRVDSVVTSPYRYEGYTPRRVWTSAEPRALQLQPGDWVARSAQPGAALLHHLLEPEDDDSFASVGTFSRSETLRGRTLPVHRLVELPRAPLMANGFQ